MKRGGLLIAGMFALMVAVPGAEAKTFEVTRTADSAPNGCNQGGCTLREAAIAANARSGKDAIVLRSNQLYRIEILGAGEDAAATGDFDLTGPTALRTTGRRPATVHADGADRQFDAFARAQFRNLKLTDGTANDGGAIRARGGDIALTEMELTGSAAVAIYSDGTGGVELNRSRISGTALYSVLDANGGGVRVTRSNLSGNANRAVLVEDGGGIVFDRSRASDIPNIALQDDGPGGIRVSRATFGDLAGEAVLDFGPGGISVSRTRIEDVQVDAINDFDSGAVRVSRTRITDTGGEAVLEFGDGGITLDRVRIRNTLIDAVNEFDSGGVRANRVQITNTGAEGILEFSEGDLAASRTRIANAADVGAEEFDAGDLHLTRTQILGSGNRGAGELGAGGLRLSSSVIKGNGGGVSSASPGTSRIIGTSIVGNIAPVDGGGIHASGRLGLVNSTVANNTSGDSGAGIFAATGSNVRLNAVTVVRNNAGNDGGGLYLEGPDGALRADNSLIALNTVPGGGFVGADCFNEQDPFVSGGHNLLSTDDNCSGFDGQGDLVRANPRIGPLKRNGGLTETVALKKGSSAIGRAGNDAPGRDQRGRRRDRNPDIGAFER